MQQHHGHSLHHRERIPPRLLLRRAATCEPCASSLTRKARLDLHTRPQPAISGTILTAEEAAERSRELHATARPGVKERQVCLSHLEMSKRTFN
jgi:hypothetical protein